MNRARRSKTITWLLVPSVILGVALIVSCATLDKAHRPVELTGGLPGATYVGADTCAGCHEEQAKHFKHDPHGAVLVAAAEGEIDGCEACHGPGSIHVDNDGEKKSIMRENPNRCFSCHPEVKAKLKLQHHHPVLEGRVTCSDCHGYHGKDAGDTIVKALRRSDDKCFKCHKEKKGPFLFEHEAMREGCQTCHDPHGTVQDKMLIAGQSTTCLRCHFDINTNPAGNLSGGVAHGSTASTTGAKGGNFDIGRGEECIDHHRAPHGSQIWRTLNR